MSQLKYSVNPPGPAGLSVRAYRDYSDLGLKQQPLGKMILAAEVGMGTGEKEVSWTSASHTCMYRQMLWESC